MRAKKNRRAIVLLSGGIDSSTSLAIAKSEGYTVHAMSFDYSQRHKRELESAKMVASAFGIKKHLIIHFDLCRIGGSALTSEREVPKIHMKNESGRIDSETKKTSSFIPVTYVPARNTIFLSFALAWAEVLEAENIFIGANAIDYSGYPDCRPEYLRAFEAMANLATKASVEGRLTFRINAPLLSLKKADIIRKGRELGLDYALTWSCYDPQPVAVKSEEVKVKRHQARNVRMKTHDGALVPCRRCDSCIFRAKGFRESGIKDPLLGQ